MTREQPGAVMLRMEARRVSASRTLALATPGHVRDYDVPGYLHFTSLARQRNGDPSNVLLRAAALFEGNGAENGTFATANPGLLAAVAGAGMLAGIIYWMAARRRAGRPAE